MARRVQPTTVAGPMRPRARLNTAAPVAAPQPIAGPDASWTKDDLAAEVERRGLTVTGTGADGAVLKTDLVAALGL